MVGCIESNPQPSPLADAREPVEDTWSPPEQDQFAPNDMGGNVPDSFSADDQTDHGDVVGGDLGLDVAADVATDVATDVLPQGCCTADVECGSTELFCYVGFSGAGVCLATPHHDACWADSDCAEGKLCDGAVVCACDGECRGQSQMGLCVSEEPTCCDADVQCAYGEVCVGNANGSQGLCLPLPEYPSCYSDEQCGGLSTCEGALECGCGANCFSQEGYCKVYDPCCQADLECPAGLVCVGSSLSTGGVCMAPPVAPQCYKQEECPEGQACLGAMLCSCSMDCISVTGQCGPVPEGCCQKDSDCAEGLKCVLPFGGQQEELGVCKEAPSAGECWTASDCAETEVCAGPSVCPCGQVCESEHTGVCQAAETPICCASDDECPLGWQCAQAEKNGVCRPAPAPGQCWDKSDCGLAETCDFVQLCPCGETCDYDDYPGSCTYYLPWGCCLTNQDCNDGSKCVMVQQGEIGKCMWEDTSYGCWSDSDCPEGKTCNGEFICGCEQYCSQYEVQGVCGEPPIEGCCYSSMDCSAEEICTGSLDSPGTCVPIPAYGECWSANDCYWAQGCKEAVAPACGELVMPQVGKCSPMPSNCCWKDDQCPDGRVCRNQGYYATDLPGFCVWDPQGPACPEGQECCWNDSDCPAESWCSGANSCACLELCDGCGSCNDLEVGTCIPWGIWD